MSNLSISADKNSNVALSKKDNFTHTSLTYSSAAYELIKCGFPASIGLLIRNLTDIIAWMFIGRLNDPNYIAGIGLGMTVVYVFFRSVAVGLGGGIDTL